MDDLLQALAVDVFHHHAGADGRLLDVEHAGDIAVVERGGGPGFANESFDCPGIMLGRDRHDFDGDQTAEQKLLAEKYAAHSPFADLREDFVLPGDEEATIPALASLWA